MLHREVTLKKILIIAIKVIFRSTSLRLLYLILPLHHVSHLASFRPVLKYSTSNRSAFLFLFHWKSLKIQMNIYEMEVEAK